MRKEGPLCKEDSRRMLSVTHVSFCGGEILSADGQFVNYMEPCFSYSLLGGTYIHDMESLDQERVYYSAMHRI
jgi:hypothetical protein